MRRSNWLKIGRRLGAFENTKIVEKKNNPDLNLVNEFILLEEEVEGLAGWTRKWPFYNLLMKILQAPHFAKTNITYCIW